VTDDFGAIGGGHANQAGDNAGTTADRSFATVGGGDRNYAVGQGSTIAGGIANHALGASSTIGGGWVNVAEFDYTTIGGGYGNMADSFYATIAGGRSNTARYTSAVGGGEENFAGDTYAIVGGGRSNSATNDYCTVGGGRANITGGGGAYATVGGGFSNNAYNEYTTIGGGHDNNSNGYGSTVCGGRTNTAGGQESAIGGGYLNLAAGLRSCVPGGSSNIAAGNYSFASGYRARANHDGTFVWADSNEADFASSGTRQFVVRAAGGVYFGTNNTVDMPAGRFINTSTNAHLTTGGMWTNASDRNAKENIRAIDPVTILQRVASMPISRWNYRTESDRVNHIGPMAQDFHAAFGTGDSDKVIGTADADGVALAAIQGLHILIEERDCEIEELKARVKSVADLEARIEEKNRAASELEARITKLEGMVLALVPYGDR